MAIIVQDSFTDIDGTDIESHLPEVGGPWYRDGSRHAVINSGVVKTQAGFGYSAPHYNWDGPSSIVTDGYCQAVITNGAGDNNEPSLLLRYGAGAGIYELRPNFYNQQVRIYHNGNIIASLPCVISGGETYKFEAIGNELFAYVNGAGVGSVVDNNIAEGLFGFISAETCSLNNFEAGTSAPLLPTNLTATCVEPTAPTAKFTSDKTSGNAPLTVQFNNATTGTATITYSWKFGDGATSTSTSPSHAFTAAGVYKVTLTATNSLGTSEYSAMIMVMANDIVMPPAASFTADDYVVSIGQVVNFTDTSSGTPATWAWNFGDGQTSASQNPTHSYAANGTYTVTLTITKDGVWTSVATRQIVVTSETVAIPPVVTGLGASPTSGSAGLAVTFTPTFAGGAVTAYLWNFGDGYTSTEQNPTHTYSQAGIFTASLTATNQYGSTTATTQTVIVNLTDQGGVPDGTSTVVNGKTIGYYIVDSNNHRVLVYERTGVFIMTFGGIGNTNGKFNFPTRLTSIGAVQGLEKIEV